MGKNRRYLPIELKIETWESLLPYYKELESRDIVDTSSLEKWLRDRSELESAIEEDLAWRYIKTNCETQNKEFDAKYKFFVTKIDPEIAKFSNILDLKLYHSPFFKDLDDKKYFVSKRVVKTRLEIFRKENVALMAKLALAEQQYGAIVSLLTVNYDGKTLTLPQAFNYLKDPNRQVRETVYNLMTAARRTVVSKLDDLMNDLVQLRNSVAQNAACKNYLEFRFLDLGRFDYGIKDCEKFHEAVAAEVCPLVNLFDTERQKKLGYETLRPWDTEVDVSLKPALKPFKTTKELVDNAIACLNQVHESLGQYLKIMRQDGLLDLDSRIGKAPGGFNYPLSASDRPFIFMNATNNLDDLQTMMHESGHAIQTFLTKDLELLQFKNLTPEIAELASMTMELVSLEHWEIFFPNKSDLNRAKKDKLESVIKLLPWIATIDKFQHWLYEHPAHTPKQRRAAWQEIFAQFDSSMIDYRGYENDRAVFWQEQLHVYQYPLYYIEYGMAQLGAIALWKAYKENPKVMVKKYLEALSLGYSKPIPEIYETAGIKFNFSQAYIKDLIAFVKSEWEKLN